MNRTRAGVLWVTVTVVLVCVLAGAGLTAYRAGLFGSATRPVAFPVAALRSTPPAVLAPDDPTAPAPTAAALARTLAPLLADRRLGGSVSASVVDAETGEVLYAHRATVPVAPASTNKIATAAAVLATAGPDHRLVTRVVAGPRPGDVVLVGGGDPTLAAGPRGTYPGAARLDLLAKQVRAAGPVRRVLVDGSLFSGPTVGPGWDSDIVRYGFGAPITALTVDGGRTDPGSDARAADPDLVAGRAFARAVGATAVARGIAPAGAALLGSVQSPPMLVMIERMLTTSDNVLAETLVRQVALAGGEPASFAGAADAVRGALARLGLDAGAYRPVDASGLSRRDRLTTGLLTAVLALAAGDAHPELRGLLTGLPVAAYSGTLARRFGVPAASAAAGRVRAKTGTLSGVSALSGVVLDTGGRQLAFAVVADGVPPGGTGAAEIALDGIGAALAACGCR
ncbi:MAG TPA: D-alanyl-D-alanine carboxypeptidase/D-alanyl-D-alanine-endopeptidase [Mycobacteriales bacterium]